MDILNFIIAIVALIIALLALQRSGGVKDLKKTTAEILRKWEQKIREDEASETEQEKKE